MLCVSHESALYYWRTNPPWFVMEGADRNIRSLRGTPSDILGFQSFSLSEREFGPDPVDILVPESEPRCGSRFRRHKAVGRLPEHSLYPIHDGIHVVSPELCLVEICQNRTFVQALEIGMEFCGTYALRSDDPDDTGRRDYALMDADAFRKHLELWSGLHGLRQARKVARYLVNGSASPMETKLYLLLYLPQKYGGLNFPAPELNPELDVPQEWQTVLRKVKIRPDLLWRKAGLVVEYDGEYHLDQDQRLSDEIRKTVLETMGYTVLQLKKRQVYNPLAFDNVVQLLARKLGKRLREPTLSQVYAREVLRRELLPDKRTASRPPPKSAIMTRGSNRGIQEARLWHNGASA